MTNPDDPGPEGGRAVAGRLVYDPSFATVSEQEFNGLVALMRDGAPRKPPTPGALWRRAYHEAMFNLHLVGVQHDLFGARPTTHMHKAKPGPVSDWKPEPVEEKLARIARDPNATFGIGRPDLSEDEKAAVICGAANWLRLGQRVRIVGSFASYDGRADRRVGRKGVIWRLCSPSLPTTLTSISIQLARSAPRRSRKSSCATSRRSRTRCWSPFPFPRDCAKSPTGAIMNPPQRRPAIRAVAFDEVGEAIARLVVVAGTDTGQASRAADFLLAWWNGGDNGHFPILHLCNCDAIIAEDMLIVMAYLAQEPTVYPDAWGYRDAMVALFEQWRAA